MLVHHWSHPTTPAGVGWDITVSGKVELVTEKGFSAQAALSEAETISVVVDDEAMEYDFKRGHRWYMVDTATSGSQLVWNGYINDQYILRGDSGEAVFPQGRRWHLDIGQENQIVTFRVIWDTDGNRPAEKADVRLTWLLASSYLSTVIDHGNIDWTGLATFPTMDAADYRPQFAADVLRDISLWTGYNHYIRYRDASADLELFMYDDELNTTYDLSVVKISNDNADLDATGNFKSNDTYPPNFPDAQLHRKGDRVAAELVLKYKAGFKHGISLTTSYEFAMIGQVADAPNVSTPAAAQHVLDRLLVQHSKQDERIESLTIPMKAADVNDVKHGQLVQAKFTHEPGWETYRPARAIVKAFSRPGNESQTQYDVALELSPVKQPITPSAGLCRPSGAQSNGAWVPVSWTADAQFPGPNCSDEIIPTVGPLYTNFSGGRITGWTFTGSGTVDLSIWYLFQTVVGTVFLEGRCLVNGSQVAYASVSEPGFNAYLNLVDTISVVPGDVTTFEARSPVNVSGVTHAAGDPNTKITGGSLFV